MKSIMDANSQTLQVLPWLSFTMESKVCTQASGRYAIVDLQSNYAAEKAQTGRIMLLFKMTGVD